MLVRSFGKCIVHGVTIGVSVNGCLFLCGPAMCWPLVQDVTLPLANSREAQKQARPENKSMSFLNETRKKQELLVWAIVQKKFK